MTLMVIIAIIVLGLVFLLLEILVVPGTTVVGFIGAGLMVFGVYAAYNNHGAAIGTYILAGTLVVTIGSVSLALKSNTWNKAMLHSELDGRVNIIEEGKVKPGDTGVTITRLNPIGKALINNDYFEVISKDNLLDQNTEIEVTKVEGNKIIVKQKS